MAPSLTAIEYRVYAVCLFVFAFRIFSPPSFYFSFEDYYLIYRCLRVLITITIGQGYRESEKIKFNDDSQPGILERNISATL